MDKTLRTPVFSKDRLQKCLDHLNETFEDEEKFFEAFPEKAFLDEISVIFYEISEGIKKHIRLEFDDKFDEENSSQLETLLLTLTTLGMAFHFKHLFFTQTQNVKEATYVKLQDIEHLEKVRSTEAFRKSRMRKNEKILLSTFLQHQFSNPVNRAEEFIHDLSNQTQNVFEAVSILAAKIVLTLLDATERKISDETKIEFINKVLTALQIPVASSRTSPFPDKQDWELLYARKKSELSSEFGRGSFFDKLGNEDEEIDTIKFEKIMFNEFKLYVYNILTVALGCSLKDFWRIYDAYVVSLYEGILEPLQAEEKAA